MEEVADLLQSSELVEPARPAGEQADKTHRAGTPPPRTSALASPVALVVDDDPDVRALFKALLSKNRFEVHEAGNGAEALEAVYARRPDLVLCDLMMPTMNGREFLVRMQATKDTRTVPIILLTSSDSEENEVELLQLGAQEFISKLSSPAVIIARLHKILSAVM